MATSSYQIADSVKLLLENDKNSFIKAANILIKIAKNIMNNPEEGKFRKLRISNQTISDLLAVYGGFQCLFDIGFQEADEFLVLPDHSSLDNVKYIHDLLQSELDKVQKISESASSNFDIKLSEAKFYQKVLSYMARVRQYESVEAQRQALQCIPLERFKSAVQKKLEDVKTDGSVDSKDLLLLELLAWFKNEFFQWMDSPKCRVCTGKTQFVENVTPSPEELKYGADRVESYSCQACKGLTRFPRYNDAVKLLSSRTGRCGEWANCFTLCCRAVGFEARFVVDWTDHVWTEVFSEKQDRWLHCDPCENVCDKPLMYEVGWKKKLSYIIAFSRDDIQDVTWRYSTRHGEVCSRRNLCRESWLLQLILTLRKQLQESLPAERQTLLRDRLLTELVEFLFVKSAGDEEKRGRTSGSLAWRVARGEVGGHSTGFENVITPTDGEVKAKLIRLRYCCSLDAYTRSDGSEIKQWQSLVYHAKNIFRKEEYDWNMAYLARTEGSGAANISWKFDLQGTDLVIDHLEVQALSTCFENGHISWSVCADKQCATLPCDGKLTSVDVISGCSVVTLSAVLSHGRGDISWQHTQLFRQSCDDLSSPLDIKLYLKSA